MDQKALIPRPFPKCIFTGYRILSGLRFSLGLLKLSSSRLLSVVSDEEFSHSSVFLNMKSLTSDYINGFLLFLDFGRL